MKPSKRLLSLKLSSLPLDSKPLLYSANVLSKYPTGLPTRFRRNITTGPEQKHCNILHSQWVYHIRWCLWVYKYCLDLEIINVARIKQFKLSNKSNFKKYEDCNQPEKCKNSKVCGPRFPNIVKIAQSA